MDYEFELMKLWQSLSGTNIIVIRNLILMLIFWLTIPTMETLTIPTPFCLVYKNFKKMKIYLNFIFQKIYISKYFSRDGNYILTGKINLSQGLQWVSQAISGIRMSFPYYLRDNNEIFVVVASIDSHEFVNRK